jgi:hypothetical protein
MRSPRSPRYRHQRVFSKNDNKRMNLRILGLDPSEVDFEPDTNPSGLRELLPLGGDYLLVAADLLDIVAPEKGASLRHILEHELVPGNGLEQIIPELDVGRIYFLLEELKERCGVHDGRVLAVAP